MDLVADHREGYLQRQASDSFQHISLQHIFAGIMTRELPSVIEIFLKKQEVCELKI